MLYASNHFLIQQKSFWIPKFESIIYLKPIDQKSIRYNLEMNDKQPISSQISNFSVEHSIE